MDDAKKRARILLVDDARRTAGQWRVRAYPESSAMADAHDALADELERMETLAPMLDKLAAEWELGNGLGKGGVDEDTVRTLVDAWRAAP